MNGESSERLDEMGLEFFGEGENVEVCLWCEIFAFGGIVRCGIEARSAGIA